MASFHVYEQPTRSRRKLLLGLLLVPLVILTLLAAGTTYWYQSQISALSPDSQEEVTIVITEGATAREIADNLESNQVIQSALAFDWYARLNGKRGLLQAGTYKFTPSSNVEQIVNRLVAGDVAVDLITILPGQRLDQIAAAFAKSGYSEQEVADALQPDKYANHPALIDKPADASLEGYLYPETFQKTAQTTLSDIVRLSLDETADRLTTEVKAALQAQGLSVHKAILFASIVEGEVSNLDDKPIVAQVFLKRYAEGMQLGSDVTALYGAEVAGIEPSVFADTPYNTRIYGGLPPGPVGNVSESSLRAVAFPASTEYLFFVSGDDGVTYFSNTLAEHEALTAQHCIELCQSY